MSSYITPYTLANTYPKNTINYPDEGQPFKNNQPTIMAMHEDSFQRKERVNLKVNDKSERMYMNSTEPEPGFHKHEYEFNNEKKYTFRKYVKGVDGKIFNVTKDDYGNTKISLTDGERNYAISISNYGNGTLSRASQSFIAVAKNADLTRHIYIGFYPAENTWTDKKGNERSRTDTRCYLKYYDVEKGEVTDEQIDLIDFKALPKVTWSEDKITKKPVADNKAQNDAFEDMLVEIIESIPERVEVTPPGSSEPEEEEFTYEAPAKEEKEETKKETKKKAPAKKEENDNPFM